MNSTLRTAILVLGTFTESELHELSAAARGVPRIAPRLLAWIEGVCTWELNRRAGLDEEFLTIDPAIDPPDDEVAIAAVTSTLHAAFSQDHGNVLRLLDEVVRPLLGGDRKRSPTA